MFKNRKLAGQLLAEKIAKDLDSLNIVSVKDQAIVLGIPRGGVVLGKYVAEKLGCLLDVIVVKKLGVPQRPELAFGAIGETSGSVYVDKAMMQELNISKDYLAEEIKSKKAEIKRREQIYRQGEKALDLQGKIVIIVDDGAATGATVIAAAREVWNHQPKRVIIGLAVLAKDTVKKLEREADELIFLQAPDMFYAVGQFYDQFSQITDEQVIKILESKL
jgi:putative phosphoribosyl transferase